MKIRILKERFRKNGYSYSLVKRTDNVYMFLVDDKRIEVGKIVKVKSKFFPEYDLIEIIPSNEQFGRTVDGREFSLSSKKEAESYYNKQALKYNMAKTIITF